MWHYRGDEQPENPGALPPGGVEGTDLEGLCCGFIWRKVVHGAKTSDLKYCFSCLKYDHVKRWLCYACRDHRWRSDPHEAHCLPGYCPALSRRFDSNWHAADLRRPQWFQEWADWYADFEQWTSLERQQQLNRWYYGFFSGRLTDELAAAQRASHSAADPWRKRETTLSDDNRFLPRRVRSGPGVSIRKLRRSGGRMARGAASNLVENGSKELVASGELNRPRSTLVL